MHRLNNHDARAHHPAANHDADGESCVVRVGFRIHKGTKDDSQTNHRKCDPGYVYRSRLIVHAGILGQLAICATLGACATAPPAKVVYQQVPMAVASTCIPAALPPAPQGLETRESLAAIPAGPDRYIRAVADDLARMARMDLTEGVIQACR